MEWLIGSGVFAWVKDLLTKRPPQVEIIVKGGGTLNVVQGDQHIHYHVDGASEIIAPASTRVRLSGIGSSAVGGSVSLRPPASSDDERPQ